MGEPFEPGPESAARPARRRGGWQLAVVALVTLGAFTGGVWYAYDQGIERGITLSPPLFRADPSPTKIKPKDPGGLEVPHQDMLVYETLTTETPAESAERLLPPPEEPLPRPQPPAPAPGVAAVAPGGSAPAAAPRPAPEAAPEPAAAGPVAAREESATARAPAAGFRIQLAAYREASAATQGWHKLSRANPSLLRGLKPSVIRVDLGADKGIFYRLQAGPIPDRETADTLCVELKRQKVGCLVVEP
ncbi:MAG: SPOR domain-containing protein [Alphaproteobacteria bacterium]|nr:SPOR domain-containing protein [Alphaproteobacteria bacterium]